MSEPIIPLQQWPEGIAQARVPANINALRVEALARPCLGVENNVVDPADGDVYIVGDTPAGAFATFSENDIAFARVGDSVSWSAWAPSDGLRLTMSDGSRKVYVGGSTNEWHDEGTGAVDSVNGQTGAVSLDAEDIPYDGTSSGLSATDVKGAIDELEGMVGGGGMANPMTTAGDIIIGGTSGAPARLGAGTDGYVLTLAAGAPMWAAAGGGGGLTHFTEGVNTSAPNGTAPYVYLNANNAAARVDAAFCPKGGGAFSLQVADGLTAGGNKRGNGAVDLQLSREAASEVVSGGAAFAAGSSNTAGGSSSVAIGYKNSSSAGFSTAIGRNNSTAGNTAVALGRQNTASGDNGVAVGWECVASGAQSTAFGQSCTASGINSTALGRGAHTRGVRGLLAYSSNDANVQTFMATLRVNTTNATPTVLTTNGGSPDATNQLVLQNNSAVTVKGVATARENATGDTASWEVTVTIKRGANAASTAIVGTAAVASISADAGAAGWSIAVTADTANGALAVTVTGEASHNIRTGFAPYACLEVVG